MPTPDEVRRELARRELAKRELVRRQPGGDSPQAQAMRDVAAQASKPAGAPTAPAGTAPAQPSGMDNFLDQVPYLGDFRKSGAGKDLLYKIPYIGESLKDANTVATSIIGRPPESIAETRQGLADMGRVTADTVTRGYLADADEKAKLEAARERLGYAAPAVELGEQVLEPSIASKVKILEKGGKALKFGAAAAEGGIQAGLASHGHGTPILSTQMLKDVAIGAGLGGGVHAASGGVGNWLTRRQAKQTQMYKTAEELAAARKAKYEVVDKSGAVFTSKDLRKLAAEINNLKLVPGVDKRLIKYREHLNKDWSGKDISPADLDLIRQDIRELGAKGGRKGRLTSQMNESVDKFADKTPIYKPTPPGQQGPYAPAPSVNKALVEGRDLFSREQRLAEVTEAAAEAQRKTKTSRFSPFGMSPESADVKTFSDLAKKAQAGKGNYTPDEIALLKQIEDGTFLRNLGGKAEKSSFSGGWFPAWANFLTAGKQLPLQAASEVVHQAGRASTRATVEDLQALIRDPGGKGLKPDPAKVSEARFKLAQLAGAPYRTYETERNSNRGER